MGYLMIDHRSTQGVEVAGGAARLTGRDGRLAEMDTVACRHCNGVIMVVLRGLGRRLSTPYSCATCRGPICRGCAEAMHRASGVCPGPLKAQIERALADRRAGETVAASPGWSP
jgi:hypothetical protein